MISLILTGQITKRKDYIDKFCDEKHISVFDQIRVFASEQKKTNAIGIEDVRDANPRLYTKPVNSLEKVVIFEADAITIEAQNALLKILEEPPQNTTIILSFPNAKSLLATILSRCKVIHLEQEETTQVSADFKTLLAAPIGDKLKTAETYGKSKEESLAFLLATIKQLRKELHQSILEEKKQEFSIEQYQDFLEKLNTTYTTIATTNVSPRFALENLFLSL